MKLIAIAIFVFSSFAFAGPKVQFETNKGNFVVELNPERAPITVANFLNYVDKNHFDLMVFHRVIENFVIQGGGHVRGDQYLEEQVTDAPIPLESKGGLSNLRGTIGMARTADPDTATSQFYFNVKDNARLDYQSPEKPGYAVFGKITSGIEVMDAIRVVETSEQEFLVIDGDKKKVETYSDVPNEDVVIRTIRRIED